MEKNFSAESILFEERRKTLQKLAGKGMNVLDAKIVEFDKSGRGEYAFLEIQGKKNLFFFPDFSEYGWNELDNKKQLGKLKGRKIKIFLDLFLILEEDLRHSEQRLKKIRHKKVDGEYSITGKVTEKASGIEDKFVVDCGIPIYITPPKKVKLEIGDWVQAEGRLDAYLVK